MLSLCGITKLAARPPHTAVLLPFYVAIAAIFHAVAFFFTDKETPRRNVRAEQGRRRFDLPNRETIKKTRTFFVMSHHVAVKKHSGIFSLLRKTKHEKTRFL